jgi:hypothetical protein
MLFDVQIKVCHFGLALVLCLSSGRRKGHLLCGLLDKATPYHLSNRHSKIGIPSFYLKKKTLLAFKTCIYFISIQTLADGQNISVMATYQFKKIQNKIDSIGF